MPAVLPNRQMVIDNEVAYADSWEHLLDELRRLDLLIHLQVIKQQNWQPADQLDQLKGLVLSTEEIDRLLAGVNGPLTDESILSPNDAKTQSLMEALSHLEYQIRARRAASLKEGTFGSNKLSGKEPVAIALSRGFLYVLERQDKKIFKFSSDGELKLEFPVDEKRENDHVVKFSIDPSGLATDAEGSLYIGDRRTIAPGEEDDRFILKFSPAGDFISEVPGFRGSVEKIAVDDENRLFIFSKEEHKIVILKRERKLLKSKNALLPTGIYFSRAFDSTAPGTRWHKIFLDREIPENTQIKVSYLISDQKTFLINGAERDLDAFLADRTILLEEKVDALNGLNWSAPLVNPKDALVLDPAGRYLWLRVVLTGSEKLTPTVKSIRVFFPRLSYLRYLPAVYQENEGSRDFLERFLSLFETFFGNLERQIDQIARFFDADAVSGDFLRWLATWLAVAVDENWTEEKLRELVKRAPELYKKRGTRAGIAEIIKLFLGDEPIIVEQFQLKCVKDRLEDSDLRLKAPLRSCVKNLGHLLLFDRIMPAVVNRGEEVEVKLLLKSLQNLVGIEIEEILQGDLRLSSGQLSLTHDNIAAGERIEHSYCVKAGKTGGMIRGIAKILSPGATSPIILDTPTSAVTVRKNSISLE